MSREFLGRGWAFPVRARPDGGGVALSEHERNIIQCVHLVLNTQPGERPMLPEFGCPLQDLVFKTNSAKTRHEAEMMVRESLHRWEPRIDVQKVEGRPDKDNPNRISLHIDFLVRKSNNHQNLVHLLHLQEFYDAD